MSLRTQSPKLSPCDFVMKGGVASGVVYPKAISELCKAFQFRGIGGTSAGAIAASLTAAAEYCRQTSASRGSEEPDRGFQLIDGISHKLAETVRGRTRLSRLFVPQPETTRIFQLVLALSKARSRTRVALALIDFASPALLFVPSLTVVLVLLTQSWYKSQAIAVAAAILGALLLGLVLTLGMGWRLFKAVEENDYGLCRGFGRPESGQLINWLHRNIQEAAGLPEAEPLTFAHLEGHPDFSEQIAATKIRCVDPSEAIKLRMIATCLSHGRPYTFPNYQSRFYFEPDELRAYFPESVIQWMIRPGGLASLEVRGELVGFVVADGKLVCPVFPGENRKKHAPKDIGGGGLEFFSLVDSSTGGEALVKIQVSSSLRTEAEKKRYYKLPTNGLLPILVPTRLSLSVPVFFSSICLYSKDHQRSFVVDGRTLRVAERVHFTDGGVSSNFPIHLFDTLLPKHPTLAINLTTFPPQGTDLEIGYAKRNVSGASDERWHRFEPRLGKRSFSGLLGAVFEAARNWTDTVQLRLPGFRDRIVDIYLTKDEGGFNLDMTPEQIARISKRGGLAGQNLRERFQPAEEYEHDTNWRNHLWIRYRIAMFLLSRQLRQINEILGEAGYQELLDPDNELPSYKFQNAKLKPGWNGEMIEGSGSVRKSFRDEAREETQRLREFLDDWNCEVFSRPNLPSPFPVLQTRSDV